MDDEETQPKCLCNAHEPRLCSGRDFFLEIQNPGPSSPGTEQEGRAEEETALNETQVHGVCVGGTWLRHVCFLLYGSDPWEASLWLVYEYSICSAMCSAI